MSADVAAIVAVLTKAQRTAVLMYHGDNARVMGGYGLPWTHAYLVERVGVNHPIFGSHYQLTALGLSVRASLQQGEGRDGARA